MNPWDHLPNAPYINFIIDLVKKDPEPWAEDYYYEEEYQADARDEFLDTARDIVLSKNLIEAWDRAEDVVWSIEREDSWLFSPALDAIHALIAWDDAIKFLGMSADELEVWSTLSQDPAALLLVQAAKVLEQLKIHINIPPVDRVFVL